MTYIDESQQEIKSPRRKSTPRPDRWFPFYAEDWIHGTRQLSVNARAAYFDVLCLIYMRRGPIPNDNRWIACSLHMPAWQWLRARKELFAAGKLEIGPDGGIVNSRAMEELAAKNRTGNGRNSDEDRTQLGRETDGKRTKLGLRFLPFANDINRGRAPPRARAAEVREEEGEREQESPLPPVNGGMHDEGQGRTYWTGLLNPTGVSAEVQVVDGKPTLSGATRERWLVKFKTDERLDIALAAIHLRLGSPEPIHRQVERSLARQVGEKLDRDDRYHAAAKANGHTRGPEVSIEETLANLHRSNLS